MVNEPWGNLPQIALLYPLSALRTYAWGLRRGGAAGRGEEPGGGAGRDGGGGKRRRERRWERAKRMG